MSEAVYHREKLPPEIKIMLRELPTETLKIVDLIPGLEDVGEILQRLDVQPKFEPDDSSGIRASGLYHSIGT